MTDQTTAPVAPEAPVRPVPTVEGKPVVPPAESAKPQAKAEAPPAEAATESADQGEKKEHEPGPKHPRFREVYGKMKGYEAEVQVSQRRIQQLTQEVEKLRQAQTDSMSWEEQETHRLRSTVKAESLDQATSDARLKAELLRQAQVDVFRAKVDAARERIPDIETAFATTNVELGDVAVDFLVDSDKGAELAYWLAKNPAEAQRIVNLPPIKQGVELARLEARFAAAPQARKISQAPSPVPTITGSAAPVEKSPEQMSMSEYMAWRKAGNG